MDLFFCFITGNDPFVIIHFGPFKIIRLKWAILTDFEIIIFDQFENIILKWRILKSFIEMNFGLNFWKWSLKMIYLSV